jgi:hypothetical protein
MVCWSEASVITSMLTVVLARCSESVKIEKNAQVVTVEIAKCYNSAIAIIEAKRPGGDKRVAGEAFGREWPEGGGGCHEKGNASKEEEA